MSIFYQKIFVLYRKKRSRTKEQHTDEPFIKRSGSYQANAKHLQILDIILNSIFIKFQGHIYENAGLSVYNIRGSQALLEEIDPDENTKEAETDDIESPTYVNVNMTHISLKMLWKYKLQNTANDILDTEFRVCKNFILCIYSNLQIATCII